MSSEKPLGPSQTTVVHPKSVNEKIILPKKSVRIQEEEIETGVADTTPEKTQPSSTLTHVDSVESEDDTPTKYEVHYRHNEDKEYEDILEPTTTTLQNNLATISAIEPAKSFLNVSLYDLSLNDNYFNEPVTKDDSKALNDSAPIDAVDSISKLDGDLPTVSKTADYTPFVMDNPVNEYISDLSSTKNLGEFFQADVQNKKDNVSLVESSLENINCENEESGSSGASEEDSDDSDDFFEGLDEGLDDAVDQKIEL